MRCCGPVGYHAMIKPSMLWKVEVRCYGTTVAVASFAFNRFYRSTKNEKSAEEKWSNPPFLLMAKCKVQRRHNGCL